MKRIIVAILLIMLLIKVFTDSGAKNHTSFFNNDVMFTATSSNWGMEDLNSDFFYQSSWTVNYDGTVTFYNEYNISGKVDEVTWKLDEDQRDKLYNILVDNFASDKENRDGCDGVGWNMSFYKDKGETYNFDGYIYNNKYLQQIIEIISPQDVKYLY